MENNIENKIKDTIYSVLKDETSLVSIYTGGGEEPTYVSFDYSEDWDKDLFLKNFAERLYNELLSSQKDLIVKCFEDGMSEFARFEPERHGNEWPNGDKYYNKIFKSWK